VVSTEFGISKAKLQSTYDEDLQLIVLKIIVQLLQISTQLDDVYVSKVFKLKEMHYMGDRSLVFKEFLHDIKTGTDYNETSLLNILA
jgi:hypothetical protein